MCSSNAQCCLSFKFTLQILRCVEIAKVKVSELVGVVKECFDTKDTDFKYVSFHSILKITCKFLL